MTHGSTDAPGSRTRTEAPRLHDGSRIGLPLPDGGDTSAFPNRMCQTQLEPRPSACPASLSPVPKTERHGQSLHRDPVDVFWGRLQQLIRPAQGDEGFLQVAVTGAAPPAPGLLNRKGDRLRTEPFGQRLQVGCSSSQCPPPQVALEETHELERMAV